MNPFHYDHTGLRFVIVFYEFYLFTLEEVVRFYNAACHPRHPAVTDEMLHPDLRDPLHLSDMEIDALVEFMKALTDPGTLLPQHLKTVPDRVLSGLTPVFGN